MPEGPSPPHTRIPWFRVLVEGVVIVGSILLAFGIDAWWDGLKERGEEQIFLTQLSEDMAAAEQVISGTQIWSINSVRAIEHVLPFFVTGRMPDADTAAFVADLYYASRVYTAAGATALFGELATSGDFSQVQDVSLRRSLSRDLLAARAFLQSFTESLPSEYRAEIRQVLPASVQVQIQRECPIVPEQVAACPGIPRPDFHEFLEPLSRRSDLAGPLNYLAAQFLVAGRRTEAILGDVQELRLSVEGQANND